MKTMHGYVLVTYGPHPRTDILTCAAAQRQIRNLRAFADAIGYRLSLRYDYNRSVETLADLPILQHWLELGSRGGSGVLFVDCLTWLLQRPNFEFRAAFAAELRAYDKHLYGIRDRCRLDQLTDQQVALRLSIAVPLLRHESPRKSPSVAKDTARAQAATNASRSARMAASLRLATKIVEIREELLAAGLPAKGKDLVRVGNERGLRTQRGSLLTEPVVSRALKRIPKAGA